MAESPKIDVAASRRVQAVAKDLLVHLAARTTTFGRRAFQRTVNLTLLLGKEKMSVPY